MYDLGFICFEEEPPYFSSYSEYEQSLVLAFEQYILHEEVLGVPAQTAMEWVLDSHLPRNSADWARIRGDAPKEVASLDFPAVLEVLTTQGLEVLRRHHKQLGTNWVLVYGLQER
jgi:hypothetical protein